MADLRVRKNYYGFATQQRRLRHLRSVSARNISIGNYDDSVLDSLQIFFTLHQSRHAKAFYTSEKIQGSLNPTWRSFNLEHMSLDGVDVAKSMFVVKVWRGHSNKYRLCMEWEVDLTGLMFAYNKLDSQSTNFDENSLLFGMFDGYYIAPNETTSSDSVAPGAGEDQGEEVEAALVRTSYDTQTLSRIQTVLRAIKQTQTTAQKVHAAIEEKLFLTQELEKKRALREKQQVRVEALKRELEWRTQHLRKEKDEYEMLQTCNYQKDMELKTKYELLHKGRERLDEKKKGYFNVRENLIKTGAQLVMRRKQLISELALIYNIVEVSENVYTIAGIRLPNSEDFAGHNDLMIEVALGYTCHLIHMIAHFLDVPVRYPMRHMGSRSVIHDHIMDKLQDRERDFPLFTKGKERFQFNYGVYLLNKNIAQLRFYCGLGTQDLRLTLPNLKSLLQLRLGVRFESSGGGSSHNALTHQHMTIPPNFGGPQAMTSASFSQSKLQGGSKTGIRPSLSVSRHKHSNFATASLPAEESAKFEELLKESKRKKVVDDDACSTTSDPLNGKNHFSSSGGGMLAKASSESVLSGSKLDSRLEVENAEEAVNIMSSVSSFERELPSGVNSPVGSASLFGLETRLRSTQQYAVHSDTEQDLISSSDDNSACESKFKMWPRGHPTVACHSPPDDSGVNGKLPVRSPTLSGSAPVVSSSSTVIQVSTVESDLDIDLAPTFSVYQNKSAARVAAEKNIADVSINEEIMSEGQNGVFQDAKLVMDASEFIEEQDLKTDPSLPKASNVHCDNVESRHCSKNSQDVTLGMCPSSDQQDNGLVENQDTS